MENYTIEELNEALRAINSIIHKCEMAQKKFPEGNSHHTLLQNRLKAMYISKTLITEKISKMEPDIPKQTLSNENSNPELLLLHIDKIHTTDLGEKRIRKNLNLDTDDVVGWCREKIKAADASSIARKDKNWYIVVDNCEMTVNAHSYTIITVHRQKSLI